MHDISLHLSENIFRPHSDKQARAIRSTKRILLLGTGTQWGKGEVGSIRLKAAVHRHTDPTDAFLVTAPTYKIMQQATLPAVLKRMHGIGQYRAGDNIFEVSRGGIIYFRTETDPDSIVGITNTRHIWGDEAGKYRLYFWQNIQARSDMKGCPIDLTTSPYSMNWVYKELIKPCVQGKRPDVDYIKAASWENPYHSLFDPQARADKQATMNPMRFNMIYGGEFGKMEGLVYDCWDDDENLVDAFQLPAGTQYFGLIDWGYFPDPFVLKIRAVTPDGRHYGVSEFVKGKLTITDIIAIGKQKKDTFGISRFYADPSQPGYIEEMNRNGLTCLPADNDIRRGIDLHYEMIKLRKYKEFRGTCPISADEREGYHYPEEPDLKPDQDSKELLPVGQNDHCFVGDTQIATDCGDKRIDEIKPGDRVLTRFGFATVLAAWCNGAQDVVAVGGLVCTPDHLIYTKNRSFVRADSLTDADSYVSISECQKQQNLMGKLIDCTRARSISVAALSVCTLLFGNTIMGIFRMGITFITRTAKRQTIASRILNWFLWPTIFRNTRKSGTSKTKKSLTHIWTRLDQKHLNGTDRMRVVLGIAITQEKHSAQRLIDRFLSYAFSAGQSIKQLSYRLAHLGFVPITVNQSIAGTLASTISESPALNVKSWLSPTNTAKQNIARHVSQKEKVYDLMVDGAHEFFANGILVSNCMDVDRYGTLMLYRSAHKNTPIVASDVSKPKSEETITEKLERLKKPRRTEYQTESVS